MIDPDHYDERRPIDPHPYDIADRIMGALGRDGDDPRVLPFFGQAPPGHAETLHPLTPAGETVHDIAERFRPDFKGWQPHDIVYTRFGVHTDSQGRLYLAPSLGVVGDPRAKDRFQLRDVTDAEAKRLREVGGAEISAYVRVTDYGNETTVSMGDYPAKVELIDSVQKPFDGDTETLEPSQQVLVRGTVVGITPAESSSTLTVRLENGKQVTMASLGARLELSEGALDSFVPPSPLAGDSLDLQATWINGTLTLREPTDLYLGKPAPERQTTYDAQREKVQRQLDALRTAPSQEAERHHISDIIHSNFRSKEDGVGYVQSITAEELQMMHDIIDERHRDMPPEARPYIPDSIWNALQAEKNGTPDVIGAPKGEVRQLAYELPQRLANTPDSDEDPGDYAIFVLDIDGEQGGTALGKQWLAAALDTIDKWQHQSEFSGSYHALGRLGVMSLQMVSEYGAGGQETAQILRHSFEQIRDRKPAKGFSSLTSFQNALVHAFETNVRSAAVGVHGHIAGVADKPLLDSYQNGLVGELEEWADKNGTRALPVLVAELNMLVEQISSTRP